MARGSFNGLYTFQDVAKIYNIDSSTIRKQVQNQKFYDNEIKKFGKTWIITEQAMINHFGKDLFIAYKNRLREQEVLEIKKLKEEARKLKEAKKEAKKQNEVVALSSDEDLDLQCDSWEYKEVDNNSVIESFKF